MWAAFRWKHLDLALPQDCTLDLVTRQQHVTLVDSSEGHLPVTPVITTSEELRTNSQTIVLGSYN